ncbi:ABC transporter permease subunit [Aetokthonos hydrillicola Thurmond2011]|jgi:arginine/lysine/histidine/glutamine transport system substrate-binding/permease protein|uniref:ABC transporter permease subunit n=1 Tax=Aetokthonos hydrillicola Thurmond2011 TaxID=2712845 RepID=A0AAP5MAV4_9CYAN|nr:ABC transporter permease subunit [Aetokthonos hydrillicola]MBO3458719.1 ABC transporter permease subunit [Aetokthonos hydrillicola CCALA 1050]MBW4585468.1 ABC transporter permease subunit [Aetokthonos hydrillicola CCALA 1050]MDR9896089.1 ABC transporter permease subunit [Aetokthonos hydrillicola Thurmond2011]
MVKLFVKRTLHLGLVFGLTCLLLFGVSSLNGSVRGVQKTLTVATEPTFAPFEFQVAGKLQGFDIELVNAIAAAAGFQVKYQNMPFSGMIPALQAKSIDAAVSAMTITEERSKTVSFSRPYFKSGLGIAVRGSNQDITNFESLKNKKIAVQIGTTGADKAKTVPGAAIRTFDDTPIALQELLNGNVDAVVHDQPGLLYGIKTGNLQGLKIVGQLLTEEYYGIPTPKNSPNLKLINQGLTKVLSNGTYAQIYKKWFNSTPPELPEKLSFQKEDTQSGDAGIFASINLILKYFPLLLQGALITLILTAISGVLGLIGGSLIGIVRLSQIIPLRWTARAYIDFFRGTPLLVQIFMIYFGIPALAQELGFTFTFDRFVAAVMALSLNSAAYIAEIVRAGIQSIESGQSEASQSLGLSSVQTMRYVIFPQAFRRMLPPLGNEFIAMLKDTSLVAVIGFEELFRKGQLIVAENYKAFEFYGAVAVVYLCLTLLSSQVFSRIETSMNPVKQSKAKV